MNCTYPLRNTLSFLTIKNKTRPRKLTLITTRIGLFYFILKESILLIYRMKCKIISFFTSNDIIHYLIFTYCLKVALDGPEAVRHRRYPDLPPLQGVQRHNPLPGRVPQPFHQAGILNKTTPIPLPIGKKGGKTTGTRSTIGQVSLGVDDRRVDVKQALLLAMFQKLEVLTRCDLFSNSQV